MENLFNPTLGRVETTFRRRYHLVDENNQRLLLPEYHFYDFNILDPFQAEEITHWLEMEETITTVSAYTNEIRLMEDGHTIRINFNFVRFVSCFEFLLRERFGNFHYDKWPSKTRDPHVYFEIPEEDIRLTAADEDELKDAISRYNFGMQIDNLFTVNLLNNTQVHLKISSGVRDILDTGLHMSIAFGPKYPIAPVP